MNPAIDTLTELLAQLPADHSDRPGITRAIEVLRYGSVGGFAVADHGNGISATLHHDGIAIGTIEHESTRAPMGDERENREYVVRGRTIEGPDWDIKFMTRIASGGSITEDAS